MVSANHIGLNGGLDSYPIAVFSGVPLNVKDGDGMIVSPVVFVY